MVRAVRVFAFASVVTIFGACSGTAEPEPTFQIDDGSKVTFRMTPADGGYVMASTRDSLYIPPGAVAEEVDVLNVRDACRQDRLCSCAASGPTTEVTCGG